jgi:hypothetical protein
MGASGNARLFGREPRTTCRRVENTGADNMQALTSSGCANGRARTTCGRQRPLGAQTGGRGQPGVRPLVA